MTAPHFFWTIVLKLPLNPTPLTRMKNRWCTTPTRRMPLNPQPLARMKNRWCTTPARRSRPPPTPPTSLNPQPLTRIKNRWLTTFTRKTPVFHPKPFIANHLFFTINLSSEIGGVLPLHAAAALHLRAPCVRGTAAVRVR